MKFLTSLTLLFVGCLPAAAEPKAYDLVHYKAKAAGLTIAFDYGDGYAEASEMRITDRQSKTTTRSVLDDSGRMNFVPEKAKDAEAKISLQMNVDDATPEKVEGIYTAGGKAIPFILRKQIASY